jgi:hypothetical protein
MTASGNVRDASSPLAAGRTTCIRRRIGGRQVFAGKIAAVWASTAGRSPSHTPRILTGVIAVNYFGAGYVRKSEVGVRSAAAPVVERPILRFRTTIFNSPACTQVMKGHDPNRISTPAQLKQERQADFYVM